MNSLDVRMKSFYKPYHEELYKILPLEEIFVICHFVQLLHQRDLCTECNYFN